MRQTVTTLTLNPSLDASCDAERVIPTHKVRTHNQRHDPGGGGINVARVLAELGQDVCAAFLSGGPSGTQLEDLLKVQKLPIKPIPIAGDTRSSLAVYETSTGQEYRFVPEGPLVAAEEWQSALAMAEALEGGWLIASGSLPRGVPEDFYGRLTVICARKDVRLVLDTSGPALAAALEAGGLYCIKPSLSEFETLTGTTLPDKAAIGAAANALVTQGKAQHVAVTCGPGSAILADKNGWMALPSPKVEVASATGAGDSFVAGLVHGMMVEDDLTAALRWAIASGAATTMTPGTKLCQKPDIDRLLAELKKVRPQYHHD
ncbi:hexose kinase [Altererythrobacter indicus]|uniref:Phosphofructokinase n=1 Tax=Altericroceibacterium indicum TaxID=374177 RepID=A0A845A6Z9_9SPHN|nr:1-phosphofructokinase family hexose kinase [Altericroceibacterium indicum]MXP25990.1 hexose kinase [Altericroceibacterium indicum]